MQQFAVALAGFACFAVAPVQAKPLGQATVTEINNDVRYRPASGGERSAKTRDIVHGSDLLRTGQSSQAELEFEDRTITRLGSNSIFSFDPQKRQFELKSGVLLFDMPKGAGGGRIITPAGTAAIEGTAGIVSQRSPMKVICLAGVIRMLDNHGRLLALLQPGQMFIQGVTPRAVEVNLNRLQNGKLLRHGLPNNQGEHNDARQRQQADIRSGQLQETPFFMSGGNSDLFALNSMRSADVSIQHYHGVEYLRILAAHDIELTGSPAFPKLADGTVKAVFGTDGNISIHDFGPHPGNLDDGFALGFIARSDDSVIHIRDAIVGVETTSEEGGRIVADSAGLLTMHSSLLQTSNPVSGGLVNLHAGRGMLLLGTTDIQSNGGISGDIELESPGGFIGLDAPTGYVRLSAQDGRSVLAALSQPGVIDITGTEFIEEGTGQPMKSIRLDVSGPNGGGAIFLTAANAIRLTDAQLHANGFGNSRGGVLHIATSDIAGSISIIRSFLSAGSEAGIGGIIDVIGGQQGVVTITDSRFLVAGATGGNISIKGGTVNFSGNNILDAGGGSIDIYRNGGTGSPTVVHGTLQTHPFP